MSSISGSGSDSRLQTRVDELEETVHKLNMDLDKLKLEYAQTAAAHFDFIWKYFSEVKFLQTQMQRYIPVRIYLDDSRPDCWISDNLFVAEANGRRVGRLSGSSALNYESYLL